MTRHVPPAAIDLIKRFEGCKLTAYPDPGTGGEPYTIGWGSTRGVTLADVKTGRTITQDEADERLAEDVAEAASIVESVVTATLSNHQFGALCSFVYNVGAGAKGGKSGFVTLKDGRPSTLLRLINEGEIEEASGEFAKWTFSGGRSLAGLVRRRAAEKALFLTPDGQEAVVTDTAVPKPKRPPAIKSEVGAGATKAIAVAPAIWIITTLWNIVLPEHPMPAEVAGAIGSTISTGVYLLFDYLSRDREPDL